MRRIFLLCGLGLFLWSGIAYTANAPHAGVVPQGDYPSTPEGWAKRYEEDARKCQLEAYDLHRELQDTRKMVVESNGEPMFVWRMNTLKEEYKSACFWYHVWVEHAGRERAGIPTPTPTPTPAPTPTTTNPGDPQRKPTPSSGSGEMPVWPRDDPNDAHVRFTREQERKLRELRDKKNKLIKEINDYLKKVKSAKPKQPQPGYKTEFDSTSGLLIMKFTTPQGVLKVYLPADMRAGDTISGSVTPEPNGETKEERARNRAALNQYQLTIANSRPGANDLILKLFRRKPPTANTGTVTNSGRSEPCACPVGFSLSASGQLVSVEQPANVSGSAESAPCVEGCPSFLAYGSALDNAGGDVTTMEAEYLNPLTEAQIDQLYDMKDSAQPPSEPKPNQFRLPTLGQNGSSVEIKGPFDGDLRTTDIKIGGQPVIKLAESPRSCIFKSPEQNFGPADITLKENNDKTKGTYRNIGVRLEAPKTSLLKSESTTMTAEVSGLQGIQKDVPLHLEASGVINMAGGNYQYLNIRPQDVKPDGRYTTTRTITGQQAGAFNVTATVVTNQTFGHMKTVVNLAPAQSGKDTNVYRIIKKGESTLEVIAQRVSDPNTNKLLEGKYSFEYKCEPDKPTLAGVLHFDRGDSKAVSINCQTMSPEAYVSFVGSVGGRRSTFFNVLVPNPVPGN